MDGQAMRGFLQDMAVGLIIVGLIAVIVGAIVAFSWALATGHWILAFVLATPPFLFFVRALGRAAR